MKQKEDLSFWKLWNLSFGFFGVQIAYALQSANISRIFATLGADPHSLSYFWILPPLMGIIVQPIVGTLSDRTWCRFGRRIPYLFIGSAVAVAVMCLLPNAGSLGMAMSTAMVFGLVSLMFLDTSINMAMQPFKMLVGDMVNERQKSFAYSIQSFLCNSGSLAGYVFPFLFTACGIANEAPKGVVPDSVIFSFYIGAIILILCVLYTTLTVKEWNPKEYAEYNERSKADVVCARLVNPLEIPVGCELRGRYEQAFEPKRTAEYRNARPFSSIATYCLLMRRAALGDLRFDECCTEYGYEDVLFGQELRRHYISIYHTDVPIHHTGIDSNESFLKKTEAAMRTLTNIAPKLDELPGAALYYNELKKKGMDWLPSVAYRLFGGMMRRNLLGRRPSLKIFHLYKLCYFAYLMRR